MLPLPGWKGTTAKARVGVWLVVSAFGCEEFPDVDVCAASRATDFAASVGGTVLWRAP